MYPLYPTGESGFDEDNRLDIFQLVLKFERIQYTKGNCSRESYFPYGLPTYDVSINCHLVKFDNWLVNSPSFTSLFDRFALKCEIRINNQNFVFETKTEKV